MNDQLLRVNNNDVSNVDKKFAIGAMRSRSGIVNLVIITIVRHKVPESVLLVLCGVDQALLIW